MSMMNENPSVIIKRKNIQAVLDFCLDNRIETKLTPRDMPEEWDIEFSVSEIMKAINLGMFLKEHKLDLAGTGFSAPVAAPKAVASPKASRASKKTEAAEVKAPKQENPFEETKPAANSIFEEEATTPEDEYFSSQPSAKIEQEEDLFM